MVNIFAAVPRIRPSVLNSTAGAVTALANPVMGNRVPAPAYFARSSYRLRPVKFQTEGFVLGVGGEKVSTA